MMRGPKPKPAGVGSQIDTVRSKRTKKAPAAEAVEVVTVGGVRPPTWLTGEALAEWNARAGAMVAAKLLTVADITPFARYCRNLALWLKLRDEIDIAGVRYETKSNHGDHCAGNTDWRALEERLRFKRCFGGLDLSAVQDLSALVWWFPVQEGLDRPALLARFWKPAGLIKEHTKRDKVPYDRLITEGALLTAPGNVIDHEAIRTRVLADAELIFPRESGRG
ncbi:hypothetical protein ASD89_17305 [Caulobacter sp. Root656]|nr:hypothetical protein ASD89_17305 [Caulobacter sp. Root656]